MAVEDDAVIAEYDVHLCNGLAGTKAQASVLYFCRQGLQLPVGLYSR